MKRRSTSRPSSPDRATADNSRRATCRARVHHHLRNRLHDLQSLWDAYCSGARETEDLGSLEEYGLAFDYVSPATFTDQKEGYFRYQLSWGGPSDEFRFFVNLDHSCHRVEYWFLDWFDGAHCTLSGNRERLLIGIWQWFVDTGLVAAALQRARHCGP